MKKKVWCRHIKWMQIPLTNFVYTGFVCSNSDTTIKLGVDKVKGFSKREWQCCPICKAPRPTKKDSRKSN